MRGGEVKIGRSRTNNKWLLFSFLVKTAIISGPSDINVTQNQEAFLPCHANGIPQPLISWYKTEETDQSIDNETQLATFGTAVILLNINCSLSCCLLRSFL